MYFSFGTAQRGISSVEVFKANVVGTSYTSEDGHPRSAGSSLGWWYEAAYGEYGDPQDQQRAFFRNTEECMYKRSYLYKPDNTPYNPTNWTEYQRATYIEFSKLGQRIP